MRERVHIGFLGLGQIGSPMAERLLSSDICLHVFDPNADAMAPFLKAGAVPHGSPSSVADAAPIVMASLPSRQVSEEVAWGPDGVARGKAVRSYVEMSTIGKECMEGIAAALSRRGIATIDAPVTGGRPAARHGTLAMMASGAPDDLAAVSPWLERIACKVHIVGDLPGQAQVMKLVCNLVVAANVVAACEGLAMGAKAGLDADQMLELLNAGTARSAATSDILPEAVQRGRFNFGARVSIIHKDAELGIIEANHLNVPVPVIEKAAETWRAATERGLGGDDFTVIIKVVEARGRTLVRSASLLGGAESPSPAPACKTQK